MQLNLRTTKPFLDELTAIGGPKSTTIRRAVHLLHYLTVVHQATDLTVHKPDGTQLTISFK